MALELAAAEVALPQGSLMLSPVKRCQPSRLVQAALR